MSKKTKGGGIILLPIVMGLLGLLLIFLLINSSLFNVSYVHVYGTERFASEILANAGINETVNVLHVDEETAREVIESNPYLEFRDIRRVFPCGVEIYVRERQPRAQIGTVNGFYVIDEQGIALSLNPAADPMLTTVENMGILLPVFGQRVSGDEGTVDTLVRVLSAISEYGLETKITAVDMADPSVVALSYEGELTVFVPGSSSARAAIARLEATVSAARDSVKEGQAIHMESEGAYYVG